jgi:hypothetical protein
MANKPGQFQKGNQMWRNLDYPGRPSKYSPEELWDKFNEYMGKNEGISWPKYDFIKSGPTAGQEVEMAIINPPSIRFFCVFANISEDTFRNYGKTSDEMVAVTSAIRAIILEIQIAGAATETWSTNIIARWAGLIDKKEIDLKTEMSDDEREDTIKRILENIKK